MALPTLSKTWEFDVNNVGGTLTSNENDVDASLIALKNALINVSFTSPWTVVSSSDGLVADANDNWSVVTDLDHNTAGSAHSWIVLQAPVGDQQICIDLNSTLVYRFSVIWSPISGFSGGTTTNRPTAADESVIYNTTDVLHNFAFNSKISVAISADGTDTRAFIFRSGAVQFGFITSELVDSHASLTDKSFIQFSATRNADDVFDLIYIANQPRRINDGGAVSSIVYSMEALMTSGGVFDDFGDVLDVANSWTGEWHIGPVGIWGTVGSQQGKIGNIPDFFRGHDILNTGDQYPATGILYQFAQISGFVIPWDSTTVIQTS